MIKKPSLPTRSTTKNKPKKKVHPFRASVIRGLAVVLPPLLTIVIFLWVAGIVNQYVFHPLNDTLRDTIAWSIADVREEVPADRVVESIEQMSDPSGYFYELPTHKFVPIQVYELVRKKGGSEPMPETATALYRRYVQLQYLQPARIIPAFLALFILVLYLLGKFMAASLGRWAVGTFERGIHQLPVIRNVYSSVKQVSDFLFSPREVEYTRVVAVEYPRKGIWSLGMVTGDSLLDIHAAANEPVISVLIPTSPMPVTGYTINVLKSEAIDMNISIDQAFQFIVSCGVVIPPGQLIDLADEPDETIDA
jgi:uncharacterized membrane protein